MVLDATPITGFCFPSLSIIASFGISSLQIKTSFPLCIFHFMFHQSQSNTSSFLPPPPPSFFKSNQGLKWAKKIKHITYCNWWSIKWNTKNGRKDFYYLSSGPKRGIERGMVLLMKSLIWVYGNGANSMKFWFIIISQYKEHEGGWRLWGYKEGNFEPVTSPQRAY